jgi:uncharacterized protein YndB with AHSA1/START domain
MSSESRTSNRILGGLRSVGGKGVVRMEDRFDTDIEDLWAALTEPRRLARWLGDFEGDLRVGGEFRAHFFSSGWVGRGRVEACEPPHRFQVWTEEPGEPYDLVIEVWLTTEGKRTLFVAEERGMPLRLLAAYGAGIQIHVEDLAGHIAGAERDTREGRWNELIPAYEAIARKSSYDLGER